VVVTTELFAQLGRSYAILLEQKLLIMVLQNYLLVGVGCFGSARDIAQFPVASLSHHDPTVTPNAHT
jgi:hypothetical protein